MNNFGLTQPTLIQQIKKILDQYPDDGQILKELIQNAEDAGAKEVKFLYDHHSYGTEHLHHPGLAKFQGPALYAYNDAKFTDDDWKGIGMLCDSIKEKDPTKVGRFGLGFKSVFHMTDLPSVISGGSLGIIDPHEKYFSDEDGKRSGRSWHLEKERETMHKISDQFAPYKGIFNCTDECFNLGSYDGTLFRLPLRGLEASKLSRTIYSQDKVRGLFECFEKDAHLILLFLMNLERIEVYERDANSLEPRKLFHVGISNSCLADVRKAREEFSAKVQENVWALSDGCFNEVKKTYHLTIETVHYHDGKTQGTRSEHSFVVTNLFSGKDVSQTLRALIGDKSLSYMPWVGVALPFTSQLYQDDVEEPKGHLFCFLPLPLENKSLTGLPVHVNGFFALSQNRRHLKWPSADQDEAIQPLTDKSLLWNKGLLNEVLPKAYAELVLQVTSRLPKENAYSAWPDVHQVDVKWRAILQPLFRILLKSKVLYSDANGGVWCKVEDILLENLERHDQSRKIVIDVLIEIGENVVTAPAHVKTALKVYSPRHLECITPKVLRNSLKEDPSYYIHLNFKEKILLLKYVLSDSQYKDLEGLKLLPLSDKTFATFRKGSDPIYIDSTDHPKSLLPKLQRMFLDTEIDTDIIVHLKKAIKKGYTQLCHFNKEAVKRHLRQTLPSDWLGSDDYVIWYPGKSNQPTVEWLKALWLYFGKNFDHRASDLDAFISLPLVPLSLLNKRKVALARIQRPSSLVLASFNGENINESACQILRSLGLTILNDIPEFVRHYPGLVPVVANPASPRGVLCAITTLQNQIDFFGRIRKLPADDIRSFRAFLSGISTATLNETSSLLRKTPLFETFPGSGGKESRFVALTEVNIGAPLEGLPDISVFTELLDLRDHSSRTLAHLLSIKSVSYIGLLNMMLDDALNNKYSDKELDKLIKYTIERLHLFNGNDFKNTKEKLQSLPFVLSSGKSRKKPVELYDPEIKILKQVFLGEDVFPGEQSYYSQPEVLIQLRKLGLKGKESISACDILRCAGLSKTTRRLKDAEATTKFKAILNILEQTPLLLQEKVEPRKTLVNCLYLIPWIPVFTEKQETYPFGLPLKKLEKGYFACPKDVTSHEFINLVGSVKLLVETQQVPKVSKYFQWNKQPFFQDVICHLDNVIEAFQESSDLDKLKTRKAFEDIYHYLQFVLKDKRDEVRELLSSKAFVIVQKQLFQTNRVAFCSQVNYPPYLCELPFEYKQKFSGLFKTVGVRECFEIHDYIETLQMVQQKYGENPIGEELMQVQAVLNSMAEAMIKECVTATKATEQYGSIFIPDSNGIMKASKEVCVKDCYWMPNEPGVNDINEKVSPQVCITLGANTRRQETLRKHTFCIPFGQKEKLTNRLKRILTGYPCDESILKELVQNADDAQASKICFINDPRQHPHERVFEECWKPLQGPALCVYNDAPFTKSDIEGIQNLGEGSKGDDPNKTGQYGVGFNAVYHLTEAPTFISHGEEIGEVMCVFDPNLKFAPGADPSNPGVMYKDLPRLRKMFTDVFPCYLGEHFPLNNATMFRFPLRTKNMARTSKISNKAMTTETLDKLLKEFKRELSQVLLFVNNVKEISVYEIDDERGEMNELYQVRSCLSPEDQKKRLDFAVYVNEIGRSLQRREISVTDIPVSKVSYILDMEDSRGLKQKWLVVQQIGFENTDVIPDNIDEAFKRGDLGLLPRGGVASLISSSEKHQNLQGKAYCFLPLPFNTGLPVHINGHFALNHEDRRSLWQDDKSDYRSNWNDTLLRQVVAPCYVTLLHEVRQHISLPISADGKTYINGGRDKGQCFLLRYVNLFPSEEVREMYWLTLCKAVYCYMNWKRCRLLPVLRRENGANSFETTLTIDWLPPTGKGRQQAFFDNLREFQRKNEVGETTKVLEKEELLRNALLDVGFNLLCMPIRVYNCFMASKVDVSVISPTDVISFFQTYITAKQLCKIGRIPLHITKTPFKSIPHLLEVLKYCKRDSDFFQRLEGLPFLLTEDGVLRVFSQSYKVFLSDYYKLLPHCKSVFVHHTLFNSVFYCDCGSKLVLSPVFETFDIAAFARLLPHEMNEDQYKTTNRYVNWHPVEKDDQIIPNTQWVCQVWKFFSHYIAKDIAFYDEEKRNNRCPLELPYFERKQREEEDKQLEKKAKKRIILEALEPVMNWCLLPTFEAYPHVRDVKYFLVPIAISDSVIHIESSTSFAFLKETFKRVVLPQLNCKLIDGGASKTARRLVADLEDPTSVVNFLMTLDSTSFKLFQEHDCRIILEYFNDRLSHLEASSAEKLKMLPFYVTIHDDVINISGKQAFVLSPRIPKEDMHIWEETSGIVFLKASKNLESLYKFLQCHSKDEVDVYCDVIFAKFEDITTDARLKHMEFVRKLLNELDNNVSLSVSSDAKKIEENKLAKLMATLTQTKFITERDGTLKTASSFYDPFNEVFKEMFENKQEKFPPTPFCDYRWISFLRQVGLNHEVSNMQFLEFAKEVETEAEAYLDSRTRRKSEALICYLFKYEDIATSQLLDDVKDICFIFAHTVNHSLQRIHAQYGSEEIGSPFICFQESVVSRNYSIAWTSANLLPDYANPLCCGNFGLPYQKQKKIARRLGILEIPSVEMVVKHCQNICNALYKMHIGQRENKTNVDVIVKVMKRIYEYLKENYDGNEEEVNKLQKTRCIVVDNGKQFVFPNQVVVEITLYQEIRPYLYKIPLEVGDFVGLFKNLGTTTTITATQYSNVLKSIHDESGKQKLHANEASKAFKATKGIFEIVLEDGVQDTKISPLYLPGVTRNPEDESLNMVFLRLSAELLYNNAPHFKERIKQFRNLVLVKLANCGMNVENEGLLVRKLPESIRPRMLTSVVHETLIKGSQPLSSSGTAQELRQTLTSNEFCHGLIRLIKHADHESDTETRSDILDVVRERLSCIRVYCISNLQTRLVCNGSTVPGSEDVVSCFGEETEDGGQEIWNIYIEKEAELVTYASKVAETVDRITGHLLKTMLVHLPRMLSLKPYEIKEFLDTLKIHDYDLLSTIQPTCLPTPGNFIHIADHHLLVDDFITFSPGEYVGYELDDPSLRGEEGTPTYIYAIIIEEVTEEDQPTSAEPSSRRYRIDVGKDKEPTVVNVAVLYKFYRQNKGAEDEKPLNLDEVRKKVRRILQGAWKLSEEERKKITKRLFLKWHPVKNPGNEQFCIQIFTFFMSEIERLEKENRPDQTDFLSTYYDALEKRAQDHERLRSSFHVGGGLGAHRRNPQPGEARRWYNQAKADLEASRNDLEYQRVSFEWACFKCHQSAEKALKAAQYSIDADKTNVHDLRTIARNIDNEHLSSLAAELESLVGDSTRMRYPDRLHYPSIPHDAYTEPMASRAMQLTSSIIQEVASKFTN